ncbi:Hsp20/alpha crystallin family protein [Mangrovibacterium marinum]|uniref:Spore coat protein M/HSP20 family protein n=1 Tax=Mangrovibacterium marinum TaxID=1639118 RepID=A0A2T5C4J7_9BACT|nr:Hsp20/alpha crystallin family protein [Mangrovibacterium marinum]PTN09776.1 spore coat protein M/HSP20 family protein [Mangrovibacterium marinum]
MKLVTANPVSGFYAIDRLLNDLFADSTHQDRIAKNEIRFQPPVNVYEYEDFIKAEMQIAGFRKEQVQIVLDKNELVVRAEAANESDADVKSSRIQFRNRDFEKRFKLSDEIDQEAIQAAFENGILTLTLPKRQEQKPIVRNIEIA